MKKLLTALILLFCAVILASCGGDVYNESAYSEALTDKTLNMQGFYISTDEFVGSTSSIAGLSSASLKTDEAEKWLRTLEFDAEYRDYYTCAYLAPAAIDIIDANPVPSTPGIFWSGINNRIHGYGALVKNGTLDAEKYPLLWVEIAKGEEIPESYRGKTLVMVTESRGVKVTDLIRGSAEVREAFYEKRELYGEASLPAQYIEYKGEISTDAMLVYGEFDYGDSILGTTEIFNMSYYHGLDITTLDGKKYVKAKDAVYTTYDKESGENGSMLLTEVCDSKTEDGWHYFELDDLKAVYMSTAFEQ